MKHMENEMETFEKMKACVASPMFGEYSVRSPTLTKMANVVNCFFKVNGKFTAKVRKTMSHKGRQMSSGVYYTRHEYYGNVFELYDSNGKLVFAHDSTETYRTNRDVAEYLVRYVFNLIEF